jgi:hypothetical protein
MLPGNASLQSAADGRLIVTKDKLPNWMRPGLEFYLVPMHWKRNVALPHERRLDAWYAWHEIENDDGWIVNPNSIHNSKGSGGEEFYLRQLMYPASIDDGTRSIRLSCPGLLRNLGHRSNFYLWITSEPGSIAIWTDFAFHFWFGRIGPSE